MIDRRNSGVAADNMDEAILVELRTIVGRHPWWHARARLTLRLLEDLGVRAPATVLDAGCGWGVTLAALEARGYRSIGLDISRSALEQLDRPERHLVEADLSQRLEPPLAPSDVVLALDVIEHLDDDRGAVNNLAAMVRPGGILILSVPALPQLFSEFDAVQGHRRRYTPETLRAAFADSGLALERHFWWGSWLVPALRRQRARPRALPGEPAAETYRRYLRLPRWPLSFVIERAFAMEEDAALRGRLKIGTSLFAVARRPDVAEDAPAS